MLSKIIRYRREASNTGKNPDSLDSFLLWMEEQRLKREGDKESIKKIVSKDLDTLIDMDDDLFSELLNIHPYTAETILLMIEADKDDLIKVSVFDDFFMVVQDEEDEDQT